MASDSTTNYVEKVDANGHGWHHYYYFDPNRQNLEAFVAEATKRSTKPNWQGELEDCVIHHHPYLASCDKRQHQEFIVDRRTDKEKAEADG